MNKWSDIDDELERALSRSARGIKKEFRKGEADFRALVADLMDRYGDTPQGWTAYNRMTAVQAIMEAKASKLYKPVRDLVQDSLVGIYTASYDKAIPLIQQAVGATIRGAVSENAIQNALKTPMGGLTVDLRLDRWEQDLARRMHERVVAGLQRGESWGEIGKGMKDTLGTNADHIQQIVATDGHRMESQAILDGAKHAESQGHEVYKVWVSMRDDVVRDAHKSMHGQRRKMNEDFESPAGGKGQAPGMMNNPADDINCRCWIEIEPVEKVEESEEPKELTVEEKKAYLESVIATGDEAWTHQKFKDGIHIGKLSPEDVDRVYQGVKSVEEQFPVKFTGITSDRSLSGAHGEYIRSGEKRSGSKAGYIQLNKKSFDDRVDFTEKDKYISKRWSISDAVGKEGMKATTQHEALHGVYYQNDLSKDWDHQLFKRKLFSSDFGKVSEYPLSEARKGRLPRAKSELFSEVGTAILNKIEIPQEFIDAFNETVEGIRKK